MLGNCQMIVVIVSRVHVFLLSCQCEINNGSRIQAEASAASSYPHPNLYERAKSGCTVANLLSPRIMRDPGRIHLQSYLES